MSDQYLQELIKDHPIWTDIRFWEGAFFDGLSEERNKHGILSYPESKWKEFTREQRADLLSRDENIVFGQLATFGNLDDKK